MPNAIDVQHGGPHPRVQGWILAISSQNSAAFVIRAAPVDPRLIGVTGRAMVRFTPACDRAFSLAEVFAC